MFNVYMFYYYYLIIIIIIITLPTHVNIIKNLNNLTVNYVS